MKIFVNFRTQYHSKKWLKCLCFLLLIELLGCASSDKQDLGHYINMIKSRAPKPIEPLPTFAYLPQFTYPENDTRRSPFKPVVREDNNAQYAPNMKRPKQPLESYPLDALKFVGILREGSISWALISQPGGLVTRVRQGDYMGQNYGQIILIKDKDLTLEETIQIEGKWEKKRVNIKLRNPGAS